MSELVFEDVGNGEFSIVEEKCVEPCYGEILTGKSIVEVIPSILRSHVNVSIKTLGRAVSFHPSGSLSDAMKKRLEEVALAGGPSKDNPLSSTEMTLYGRKYRVNVHNNFLLTPHQELLESILTAGDCLQLNDESYDNGDVLSWSSVINAVNSNASVVHVDKLKAKAGLTDNKKVSKVSAQHPPFQLIDYNESYIDRDSVVISISLYRLAQALGQEGHITNYKRYIKRIFELDNFKAWIDEIDDFGNTISSRPLKFFDTVHFIHNPNLVKNGQVSKNNKTENHVLIVVDKTMLKLFATEGYLPGRLQKLLCNYRSPTMKSFIRFLLTNTHDFIESKPLSYHLKLYNQTRAFPSSRKVMSALKSNFIKYQDSLSKHFGFNMYEDQGKTYLYIKEYVNNIDNTEL